MIQFQSSDLQRHHMKTEWHRYNLKRRVAQLAPISASLFAEKLQLSNREQELNQVDEFGFPVLKPVIRSDSYLKKGGRVGRERFGMLRDSHPDLRSVSPASSITSHASRATFRSTDLEEEEGILEHGFTTEDSASHYSNTDYESSDEVDAGAGTDRASTTECIYCGKRFGEVETNVRHMFSKHGLFIPERSYLTDLSGLLNHLIEIIIVKKNCLCCSYQGSSVESIRAHMSSKYHCRLPYESKSERAAISQFYDFSSLDEASTDKSRASSTVSTAPSVSFRSDDTTLQLNDEPIKENETNNADDAVNSNYALVHIDDSGVELQLGNGVKVGHRSMQRYYRQNVALGSNPTDDRRTVVAADRRLPTTLESRHMKKAEKHIKQLEKQKSNKNVKLHIRRANHQTHYRDEMLQ